MVPKGFRFLLFLLLIWISMPVLLCGTPVKDKDDPAAGSSIFIFAAANDPYVSIDEERPGFLVELVRSIVVYPEKTVVFHVSMVEKLVNYGVIHDIGLAAIGTDTLFSAEELQVLSEIDLYRRGGKQFKLYFNTKKDLSTDLLQSAEERLKQLRRDGTYDALLRKYGLQLEDEG